MCTLMAFTLLFVCLFGFNGVEYVCKDANVHLQWRMQITVTGTRLFGASSVIPSLVCLLIPCTNLPYSIGVDVGKYMFLLRRLTWMWQSKICVVSWRI